MSIFEAILMGIIQGMTEFLPVSSSGHLAILKRLFGIELATDMLFNVMIHVGTLTAILIAFRKDMIRLFIESLGILFDATANGFLWIKSKITRQDITVRRVIYNGYRKFIVLVMVSSIPTAIIGYTARDLVEVSGSILLVPGICLMITAVLLFFADRMENGTKTPKHVSYTNAFIIGICQGISALPGLSRSGTTIAACLFSGFDQRFAIKYSFIMSVPAILGAALLEMQEAASMSISLKEFLTYLIGTVTAVITGYISIKTMFVVIRKKKFLLFAIYCFVVGGIATISYFVS